MNICEVWLVLKEVKALLPVASLWASLDYKSVANWPIMVSRILLLTKLISEIKPEIHFQRVVFIGQRYFLRHWRQLRDVDLRLHPERQIRTKVFTNLYFCTLKSNSPSDFDFWSKVKTEYKTF